MFRACFRCVFAVMVAQERLALHVQSLFEVCVRCHGSAAGLTHLGGAHSSRDKHQHNNRRENTSLHSRIEIYDLSHSLLLVYMHMQRHTQTQTYTHTHKIGRAHV